MGQRLVVYLEKGDESIAAIYYHWSAYTESALYETKKIIDCIYNRKDETTKEMLLRLIRLCEEDGGGIDGGFDSKEWKYIQALYPNETFKQDSICRTDGLIALSKEGILEMQRWSDGDVFINLDEDRVDFCVYAGYDDTEEYIENRKSWDDDFEGVTLDQIPYVDCDLGYFDVSEIDNVIAKLDKTEDWQGVIRCRGEICELIE